MSFTDFITNKNKLTEEAKKVSTALLKNLIDIINDYVVTEYDISDTQKKQIVDNMKVAMEEHNKGVVKRGPRFMATSYYDASDTETEEVEISIEIVTEKMGKKKNEELEQMPEPIEGTEEELIEPEIEEK